jgi:hypothetical protein
LVAHDKGFGIKRKSGSCRSMDVCGWFEKMSCLALVEGQ